MKDQEISKYLSGKANEEEEQRIHEWIISSKENAKKFHLLKAQHIASTFDETANDVDVDKRLTAFLKATDSAPISKPRRIYPLLKYAASVAIILGLGYVYFTDFFNNEPAKLVIPEEKILLILEDGKVKAIKNGIAQQIVDSRGKVLGAQSGDSLIYFRFRADTKDDEVVYHTLTVPYGKKLKLVLSDGTKAHLNSGTTIKYPTNFLPNTNREVFITGEAFFEVVSDARRPFIVSTNELEVKVLGTKFNVTSYPEDEYVRTVLVEGSVSISTGSDETTLKPEYQALWFKENNNVTVEETETSQFTAWIDGRIVFRHMPFNNIVKKLERHYNVSIISNNEKLNTETFTASFDVETIEQVLEAFNKNYSITYTIKDNEIIIN